MNYCGVKDCDFLNGNGLRISLWVSGCTRHCPGCCNPEAQSFDFGKPFDSKAQNDILKMLGKPYIDGLTILGGEPFEPSNQRALIPFLKRVKALHPEQTIWCYTGFTLEELIGTSEEMLYLIDILVDGPFIEKKRDWGILFRGSTNQRIIDMNKYRETGKIITPYDRKNF